MYCVRCGRELDPAAVTCPSCGRPVVEAPLMPDQNRIAGHVRLLGIFWIALSAFRLIPGLVLLAIFQEGGSFLPPEVPPFVHGILQLVGTALLACGTLGIIAGWGLLARRSWARMLAIVMGCLGLVDMPLGTALGIYTLWVLLPAASEEQYRRLARVA